MPPPSRLTPGCWRRWPGPSNIWPPAASGWRGLRRHQLNPRERFARGLVRWRWAIVVVWSVIGVFVAMDARATESLLNIRGGSNRQTEASRAEEILSSRFDSPVSEFFAVTLAAPASF